MKLYSPDITKPTEVNYYWHEKVLVKPMPKPKQGEWVKVDDSVQPICSKCGISCSGIHRNADYSVVPTWNYCPNCGSKMKGAGNEIQNTLFGKDRVMTHEIKMQKEFAEAVFLGEKTFEVRNNDRGYQKGDLIKFKVMDKAWDDPTHPLNDMTFKITYVLGSFVGLAPDYVAFAIRDVTEDMKGNRY